MIDLDWCVAELRGMGWTVTEGPPTSVLPEQVVAASPDYAAFFHRIRVCSNPEQDFWLLGSEAFEPKPPNTFRWNELELMSLEAARKHPKIEATVLAYWTSHFPIAMSVEGDYAYAALVTSPSATSGQVVLGWAPEFEDPLPGPDDFARLFTLVLEVARTGEPEPLVGIRRLLRERPPEPRPLGPRARWTQ